MGLFENTMYRVHELQLGEGDIMVLFTDGIVEAMNGAKQQFSAKRLQEVIKGCLRNAASNEIVDNILKSVKEFTGPDAQNDDMSIVVVKMS